MIETVETESWAQPGVHPGGMSRAAALAEERGRLRELGAGYFSADARAYEVADAVERNRQSGLYQEDRRFSSPEHFVADGSGISLRSVQRHVKLARAFPRHAYLELRKEDICLTTLERIAEAQPEARPALLAIARQVKDVVAVCAAYTAWLRQRQKLQAMEDPEAVMLEAALRSLRQRRAEHRQRDGKDGKPDKDGKADKDVKPAGEQRNLDRDPGPGQGAEKLAAEKLAKLAAERDHLRVEHELMTAERDRLAAERDQLRAEREKGSAQGTLDPAEREQWAADRAAADKMSADLTDKLSAESAARATLQADHQRLQDALTQTQAALTQTQAALTQTQDALKKAEAALAERQQRLHREQAADLWLWEERLRQHEAALAARDAEVAERQKSADDAWAQCRAIAERLRAENDQLDQRDRSLNEERQNLDQRERDLLAAALMADDNRFRWRAQPGGLSGSLMYIADLLENAAYAANLTYQINVLQRGDHLKPGELGLALEAGRQISRVTDATRALVLQLAQEFKNVHPRLAAEEFDAYHETRKLPAGQGAHASLKPLKPIGQLSDGFAVPIRALVGTTRTFVKERGLLGTIPETGEGIALPLAHPLALLLVGLPNAGKTHLLLCIIEMLHKQIPHISTQTKPLLPVWFHFGLSDADYAPALARAMLPNGSPAAVENLKALGAAPCGLAKRLVVFVPPHLTVDALEQRRREYPGAEIRRIRFGTADRYPGHMSTLLQIDSNDTAYQRWMDKTAARLGDRATSEEMHAAVNEAFRKKQLDAGTVGRLRQAIDEAGYWLASGEEAKRSIWAALDDAAVLVDLRAANMTLREALGATMMLLASLSMRKGPKGELLAAVAVLDELGKIIAAGGLSPAFVTLLNELRHRLLWLLISCQLPSELPEKILGLCNGIFAGRTESEAGHRTLCAAKPGYTEVSREVLARLPPGTFATCFGDASDKALAGHAFLLKVRDTCATPGGETKSSSAEPDDSKDPGDSKDPDDSDGTP